MKKFLLLIFTTVFVCCAAYVAQGQGTSIAKDVVLTVKDHSGDNFLVMKVEECVLSDDGTLTCAMAPQKQAKPLQAGPAHSVWNGLAYPAS